MAVFTRAEIDELLRKALETGRPESFQEALRVAAQHYGITRLAQETGMIRENIYKALRGSQMSLAMTLTLLKAMGYRLKIEAPAEV